MTLDKMIIALVIALLHPFIIEPFFHEMGHAIETKKIEDFSAIAFYVPFAPKFKITVCGVDIYNVKNKRYKNITYSQSNYMKLSDEEIIRVARKGPRNTIILAIIIALYAFISQNCLLKVYSLMFFILIILAKISKKENDFYTIKNPQKFRRRMGQLSENSYLKYESLLKEYNK